MSSYRSLTQNVMSGTVEDVGHTIGLAAILMRLIELMGEGDKDKINMIAEHLSEQATADIDRMNDDAVPNARQHAVKKHAKEAINQALLPAINFETVQ